MRNISIGIDAQSRGLAIAQLDIEDGRFIRVDWLELQLGIPIEQKMFGAYTAALEYIKDVEPSLSTIELPMASQSSSSMELWGIYGAVCSAIFPYSLIVEGIGPSSWKKLSGLNRYGKLTNRCSKNGIIEKKFIKDGVIALVKDVPHNLEPADIYDSIGIAKAGIERNLERVGRCS